MAFAVKLRDGSSSAELRRLAAGTKNAHQSRRFLSLAAVQEGLNKTEAARTSRCRANWFTGSMRTVRSAQGQLVDRSGTTPFGRTEQALAQLMETGPDTAVHAVVHRCGARHAACQHRSHAGSLDAIARTVAGGPHAVLLLERAG